MRLVHKLRHQTPTTMPEKDNSSTRHYHTKPLKPCQNKHHQHHRLFPNSVMDSLIVFAVHCRRHLIVFCNFLCWIVGVVEKGKIADDSSFSEAEVFGTCGNANQLSLKFSLIE
jgi:hypothetical protein